MTRRWRFSPHPRAFALVACLLILVLLMVVALGLVGLSTIELRSSKRMAQLAEAQANARLALMQAIGQLQKHAGPDQRISAPAEILSGAVEHPQWTGVWSSRKPDGTSYLQRDDLAGGLTDARSATPGDAAANARVWLVSGEGATPREAVSRDPITLVGRGSLPVDGKPVTVPKVTVTKGRGAGNVTGHLAWWTGDLGIRANVRTPDAFAEKAPNAESADDGGYYRVMASQRVEEAVMEGAAEFPETGRPKLTTAGTVAAMTASAAWSKRHYFDFTVDSLGVLADVDRGGLKRDLTAYLASDGVLPAKDGLPGLADDDPLVGALSGDSGDKEPSRLKLTGPRFGVLRNWAQAAAPFRGQPVKALLAETDPTAASASKARALANEAPVKLAGNRRAALQPILVEATNYTQMSCYLQSGGTVKTYQLRQLMYPRVVLWNPYNIPIQSDRMIAMIQGNGRQEMWTENQNVNKLFGFPPTSQWLNFEGGRSTSFTAPGGIMNSDGYKDPYMGSYYFSIPETTFQPGECLVFSPAKSAEYDGLSAYRPGTYDLSNNVLSCEVAPDPARSYYVSASDIGGGINYLPVKFWYAPTPAWSSVFGGTGVVNQSDDTRVILKSLPQGTSSVTFATFDALPQVAVISASLQFGAGKEPRIAWGSQEQMPMQLLSRDSPRPTTIPNVRTRESVRLRWFQEHPSNLMNSGKLAGTPFFEEALFANWNPRAAYIVRSPWDNIGGSMPVSGSAGGPWFFGAYTRDLYDQAVSWEDQTPVLRDGRYHGNPFGPPQEGRERMVLFDVPREETGVISLGQLQHVKLSDLIWHPSFAIGNSLADPRLGTGGNAGLEHSAALSGSESAAQVAGFDPEDIGWSNDVQRSINRGEWAATARSILGETPSGGNLVYDLSFEANRNLWDAFYLSTGDAVKKERFLRDPRQNPLPNGRLRLIAGDGPVATEDLTDFHRSAAHLMVDGSFNVNSTRVEAWKALLASTRRAGFGSGDGTPFPRVLDPQAGAWTSADAADSDAAWSGFRKLTDEEIDRLATAIVEQVKLRGPFLSLADFVNRRLAADETGREGALQAAIDRAGLNERFDREYPLDNHSSLPDYRHPDNIRDATRLEQTLKPASKAWGVPGYLTQADVLQVIGPVLSARSDTFVIRAYGDSVDEKGAIQARVWCEAVVQRVPQPVRPDLSGLNPKDPGQPGDFGRRFWITSFRWLAPAEI